MKNMNPTLRRVIGCAALAFAALAGQTGPASATLVHSGDSTIQGSLCVGFDCAANEPMGFATIKIEENNLRISAADSSTVAGFPTTDWQIEFNSSASGGGSYFMIRDCGTGGAAGGVNSTCGGTAMLTIEGGADNESIHVDSSGNQGGNVGFGTASPVVDLHVLSGNTPTLRLEQDNSSGFSPQSWDIAGNEANFFIRDVTNGSALPIRIEPGTASNTLYLDNQEFVGVGTSSPAGVLHVRRTDNAAMQILFENANAAGPAVQVRLKSDSDNNRRLIGVTSADAVETQIVLGDDEIILAGSTVTGGNLWATINASGITTQGPDCGTPCDKVFDPAVYQVESIEDHAAFMWTNQHLAAVGPTGPDLPFNVTEKTAGMLHELEKAHIYIEQLNGRIKALEEVLAAR